MSDRPEPSSTVTRAARLDADGRHDDAINELALGAQQGDVEATTRLAKRIIAGDRAPCLQSEGIGLLRDAADHGGAEAAARLAVITAAGFAGAPNWAAALRLLNLAAERGWAPAQGQLDVLASMSAGSDAIDLRELLAVAPGSVIHEDPRICLFPEFLSDAICDWLIDSARGRLVRALVYDVVNKVDVAGDTRTNSAANFNIMDADLVHLAVQARIAAACGQPVAHMEPPAVLHYAVGETIGDHYDFIDPEQPGFAEEVRARGTRVLTFLVYLNADYEAGETVFPRLALSHAGRRGEGMYFVNTLADGQADIRTLHNGKPPTRGEKWIFSQFVRNRPMTAGIRAA